MRYCNKSRASLRVLFFGRHCCFCHSELALRYALSGMLITVFFLSAVKESVFRHSLHALKSETLVEACSRCDERSTDIPYYFARGFLPCGESKLSKQLFLVWQLSLTACLLHEFYVKRRASSTLLVVTTGVHTPSFIPVQLASTW